MVRTSVVSALAESTAQAISNATTAQIDRILLIFFISLLLYAVKLKVLARNFSPVVSRAVMVHL